MCRQISLVSVTIGACLVLRILGEDTRYFSEDFSTFPLHYWYPDRGDEWRTIDVGSSEINKYENFRSSNVLLIEADKGRSYALYFNDSGLQQIKAETQLKVVVDYMGCKTLVQLYWRGAVVMQGPRTCSPGARDSWISLQFETYFTEFDSLDMFLLVTNAGRKGNNSTKFYISKLDVTLIPPPWRPVELTFMTTTEDHALAAIVASNRIHSGIAGHPHLSLTLLPLLLSLITKIVL